jgi:hypothetical protein
MTATAPKETTMKEIDTKDPPDVSGGFSPGDDCFPPFPAPDYPSYPVGPAPDPVPYPNDPEPSLPAI